MKKVFLVLVFLLLVSTQAQALVWKHCTLTSSWIPESVEENVCFCTGKELNQSYHQTSWDQMQVYGLVTVHKDGQIYELIMEIDGISNIVNFAVEEFSFLGISQSLHGKVVKYNLPDFTITVGETSR
ncbi:MAG: hypothetical protein AB2L14_35470 [Candidatus Xenobiia bacterium LiM19]